MRDGAQVLANVLDDLSFRSSKAVQLAALEQLHAILADVCVGQSPERPWSNQLSLFLSLQNDFETNIVSRILSSGIVSASAAQRAVDELRAKGASSAAADVIALALSALQGMALIHARSKVYMGRKASIQALLELLTALRHASTNPDDPDTTVSSANPQTDGSLATSLAPLACSVIDTLLCLLVDSPVSLRAFEECNGLEVIVRTLKKVTGQQVRMKCLEFLYFYLQDEEVLAITGKPSVNLPPASKPASTPAKPRVPQTPRRPRSNQTPAKESRTRATPLSRTVSGDSTFSNSSELRSVSRASTASQSSVATNSTSHSNATTDVDEGRFPRTRTTLVIPSLSYSSSTVSSASALDPSQPLDSRPTTPGITPSLSDECFVPLPESPSKLVDETPRRRKVDDTPRAKKSSRSNPGAPPFPKLDLFPIVGDKGSGATSVGLSLLKGEVDYTPTSPRKTKPSAKVEDVFTAATAELKGPHKSSPFDSPSKLPTSDSPVKTSPPDPSLKSSAPESASKTSETSTPKTPKPTGDLGVKQRHRPRTSEVLPRPVLAKTGPRNVSTPTPTTPTTPVEPSASSPLAKNENTAPIPATPAPSTPARAKKAVLPGGMRTPGPAVSSREELRKSVGVEGLRKSQSQAEGLRRSVVVGEKKMQVEVLRSQASLDGLRKSQAGSDASKRSSDALRRSPAGSDALKRSQLDQEQTRRLKKSTSSLAVGGRQVRENADGEKDRRSGELDRDRRSAEIDRERCSIESERERRSIEVDRERRSIDTDAENGRPTPPPGEGKMVRSSAEKKELLGAWLGNVDALVEGVQRAGVWGLR